MHIHQDLCIAVIGGGPSAEAVVSRVTANGVIEALRETYHDIHYIELDKDLDSKLLLLQPDVVFPALHGKLGEDGHIQGFLTIAGYPYVGSGVQANAIAINKILAKQVFQLHHLPTANSIIVIYSDDLLQAAQRALSELGNQVVIKPACEGSSIGVSFAHDLTSVQQGIEKAFSYGSSVLIEERIVGTEITAGILERNNSIEVLPVIEIRTPANTWYDYEHRYQPGLSEHIIPAPLPVYQYQRVQEITVLAHQALGCRDLSRADFIVPQEGEPILLEVNTIPGMTPTSLYPDEAKAIGISFAKLVSILVEQAFTRGN